MQSIDSIKSCCSYVIPNSINKITHNGAHLFAWYFDTWSNLKWKVARQIHNLRLETNCSKLTVPLPDLHDRCVWVRVCDVVCVCDSRGRISTNWRAVCMPEISVSNGKKHGVIHSCGTQPWICCSSFLFKMFSTGHVGHIAVEFPVRIVFS